MRHYAPAAAGAAFLPLIVLMFLFSARVGALVPRVGERPLLIGGAGFAGVGFVLFALFESQRGYVHAVLPGVLVLGVGMTLCVAPLTTAVLGSVPQSQTGVASAVNNALSRLAALVALSLLAFVLAHGFATTLASRLSTSQLSVPVRQQMWAGRVRLHDVPIPKTLSAAEQSEAAGIVDAAFLSGFRSVMLCCAFGAWAGSLAVLVLLKKDPPGRLHSNLGE